MISEDAVDIQDHNAIVRASIQSSPADRFHRFHRSLETETVANGSISNSVPRNPADVECKQLSATQIPVRTLTRALTASAACAADSSTTSNAPFTISFTTLAMTCVSVAETGQSELLRKPAHQVHLHHLLHMLGSLHHTCLDECSSLNAHTTET